MAVQQGEVTLSGPLPPTQTFTGYAPVDIFAGITITEPSSGALDSAQILYDPTVGALTTPVGYTGAPLQADYSPYGFIRFVHIYDQSAEALSADLSQLIFTPMGYYRSFDDTQAAPILQSSYSLDVTSSAGGQGAGYDASFEVLPPEPVTVSLSSQVSYGRGVFTLSGSASSSSGGVSVEISALVDGARRDLGAATVSPDGSFTFSDHVGDGQSFIQATLTDSAGRQATSADPGFNLSGGFGPNGRYGEQNSFDAAEEVSTAVFRPNGQRFLSLEAPGQTVDPGFDDIVAAHHEGGTAFVFTPGEGVDTVGGFKVGGAEHDTIDLPSSDFRNFAAVLRNTSDEGGSAFITDPNTGDAIRLVGVTTAELKAHPKDVAFS